MLVTCHQSGSPVTKFVFTSNGGARLGDNKQWVSCHRLSYPQLVEVATAEPHRLTSPMTPYPFVCSAICMINTTYLNLHLWCLMIDDYSESNQLHFIIVQETNIDFHHLNLLKMHIYLNIQRIYVKFRKTCVHGASSSWLLIRVIIIAT